MTDRRDSGDKSDTEIPMCTTPPENPIAAILASAKPVPRDPGADALTALHKLPKTASLAERAAVAAEVFAADWPDSVEAAAERLAQRLLGLSACAEANERRKAIQEWLDDQTYGAEHRRLIEHLNVLRPVEARRARFLPEIKDPKPEALLSLPGDGSGIFLARGEAAILSGAGGVGKSALAGEIALAVAAGRPAGKPHLGSPGGAYLFDANVSGAVLWLTFEERPGAIAERLDVLAKNLESSASHDARAIAVLNMAGAPLFGPPPGGSYNGRSGPQPDWKNLANEAARIEPVLILVDPALAAYVGDANAAAPVREFVTALVGLAQETTNNAGVLIVAHSSKANRSADDPAGDPGHTAGSTAWHDAVRGVAVLDYVKTPKPRKSTNKALRAAIAGVQERVAGQRLLSVVKANMGRTNVECVLHPRKPDKYSGWIVGFSADTDGWLPLQTMANRLTAEVQDLTESGGKPANDKPSGKDEPVADAQTGLDFNGGYEGSPDV